eukprot:c28277_g1_i1 orf=2376-4964(+)
MLLQPSSQKAHQIIAGTAKFVSEHGGQSEIILRVKQGDNPMFGFLNSDHHLHEYFRYLVCHPQLVGATTKAKSTSTNCVYNTSESLSLLGSLYGTGDEEDEAEAEASASVEEEGSGKGTMENGTVCNQSKDFEFQESGYPSLSNVKSAASEEGSPWSGLTGAGEVVACSEVEVGSNRDHDTVKTLAAADKSSFLDGEPHSLTGTVSTATISPVGLSLVPPLQLKLVIHKMVEFIVRNGQEFEKVVKDRARTDGRFQFLLPWNDYHSYYLQTLEAAQKVKQEMDTSDDLEIDTGFNRVCEKVSIPQAPDSPLKQGLVKSGDVTGSDTFLARSSSNPEKRMKIVIGLNSRKDATQSGAGENIVGKSSEASAAVKSATGRLQIKMGLKSQENRKSLNPPSTSEHCALEECGMSADAAAAVVMAATRGLRRLKNDSIDNRTCFTGLYDKLSKAGLDGSIGVGSEGPSTSGAGAVVASGPGAVASGSSRLGDLPGSKKDEIMVVKAIARAAALAAAHEADSADARLTPGEKQKAERLRRAKMFVAMMKNGEALPRTNSDLGGSLPGVSASVRVDGASDAAISVSAQQKGMSSDKGGNVVVSDNAETKGENLQQLPQTEVHSRTDGDKSCYLSKGHRERHHHEHQRKKRGSHQKGVDEDRSHHKMQGPDLECNSKVDHHNGKLHHGQEERSRHKKYYGDSREHDSKDRSHRNSKVYAEGDGNDYCKRQHRYADDEGKEQHKKKRSHSAKESEDQEQKHGHNIHRHLDSHSLDEWDEKQSHKRRSRLTVQSDDKQQPADSSCKRHKHRDSRSICKDSQSNDGCEAADKVGAEVESKADASGVPVPVLAVEDVPDDIRAKVRAMLLSSTR